MNGGYQHSNFIEDIKLSLRFIDIEHIQLILNLKQLDMCSLVYPSVVHLYFEHSNSSLVKQYNSLSNTKEVGSTLTNLIYHV